jgi:hypothetical protein
MSAISKISDITITDIAEYLRLPEVTNDDEDMINTLLGVAKTFIQKYTGIAEENMDSYQDFVIVVLVLCQDMWDNRTLYVDKSNLNYVVETILGMHSVNLLPTVDDDD